MVVASLPTSSDRPQVLTDIWAINAKHHGDRIALWAPHNQPEEKYTYAQVNTAIQTFAAGLQALGAAPGDRVAIIADNSPRWLIADQGSLIAGTVNVPRSSTAPTPELDYILEHSGSTIAIFETVDALDRLQASLDRLGIQQAIVLSDEVRAGVTNFAQLMQLGQDRTFEAPTIERSQLATLIYTSGTTGRPKGVMLTHGNFMHQVESYPEVLGPSPGDRLLSILPTWHSYERTAEYFFFSQACEMVYTTRRYIKQDLKDYQPHFMVAVPRIWETVYEGAQRQFREKSRLLQKVIFFCLETSAKWVGLGRRLQGRALDCDPLSPQAALMARAQRLLLTPIHLLGDRLVYRKVRTAVGPNFRYAVSGGGALAAHLETFYEIVGIDILVGYGLTETSPVLSVRRVQKNVRGTSGPPIKDTEFQICDPETMAVLPQRSLMSEARRTQGLVLARGPQVMRGYYGNPEATDKVLSADGWFDTGDLGWLTPTGEIVLTGRAKDTIVLSNGENIEPQPLEDVCAQSTWVDQIVLVGQDQKRLGALIYPNGAVMLQELSAGGAGTPKLDPQLFDRARQLTGSDSPQDWAGNAAVLALITAHPAVRSALLLELQKRLRQRSGFRPDEQLGDLRFVPESFSMENGLMTQTYKIRRNRAAEKYLELISEMYGQP